MKKEKDPMGMAIADYYKNGVAGRLRVFSPNFDEDEIPVDTLYREYEEMPKLEQTALTMAKGNILDIGAGAGCHSLALQDMGKKVVAIDISPLAVETMKLMIVPTMPIPFISISMVSNFSFMSQKSCSLASSASFFSFRIHIERTAYELFHGYILLNLMLFYPETKLQYP